MRQLKNGFTISVIIPAYNSAAYILAAIQSVQAQTYADFEIIVVDDGSTDNTRATIHPYRSSLTFLSQKNRGVSAARNLGIEQARGELIAFLDADDLWLPDKLEKQVQFLQRHRDVALVFGDAELFDGNGTIRPSLLLEKAILSRLSGGEVVLNDAFDLLLEENFIVTSTVMMRRASVQAVGGFDESLRSVEDRDLWLRVAGQFPIGCVPATLSRKRVHDSNVSADDLLATQSLIRVLEKPAIANYTSRMNRSEDLRSRLATLYFWLGYCYFDRGDYKRARENFRASVSRRIRLRPLAYYLATLPGKGVVPWARAKKRHFRQYGIS